MGVVLITSYVYVCINIVAVPSANKKDQRSIEQTLADIQSKKKKKLSLPEDGSSSVTNSYASGSTQ